MCSLFVRNMKKLRARLASQVQAHVEAATGGGQSCHILSPAEVPADGISGEMLSTAREWFSQQAPDLEERHNRDEVLKKHMGWLPHVTTVVFGFLNKPSKLSIFP
jgi:hypothetical protein